MKFRKYGYYVLIALLLIVFVVSAYFVAEYVLDSKEQKHRYDNLASLVSEARTDATENTEPSDGAEPTEEPEGTEAEDAWILPEYREVYQCNSDLVGWLSIDDTDINYPVVQTPDEPDYYLYRDFYGEYNIHGCLYAREQCDINAPSDNITIYGHHMRDGSMFGSLKKYRNKSYWENHSTLRFDTLTEHHTYQIFAVFKTTATLEGFAYHQFVDALDEADFDDFIATCKKLSRTYYDTGITPSYGDKIICLSTCEYTQDYGRFVVAAVMVS